jgi:hypothetical protein
VSAALIFGGMWFLSLLQLTVAASWSGGPFSFLSRHSLCRCPPAPHVTGRLLTIRPDVAKLLGVVTLRKITLCPVSLNPDGNVANALQLEISWDFAMRGRVIRKRGRCLVILSSEGDERVVVISLTLTTSNPRVTSSSVISSAGVL